MSREDLIKLCEDGSRSEEAWNNRDSERSQRQLGELWMLLRAGCEFTIEGDSNECTIWIAVTSKGFQYFEIGEVNVESFYVPTRERLDQVGDGDWYC